MKKPGYSHGQYMQDDATRQLKLYAHTLVESIDALKAPGAPEPARGMKGLDTADRILRERGAIGVAIGSMLERIWSHNGEHAARMREAADTDVLVLANGRNLEPHEGGIDWFKMRAERLRVITQNEAAADNYETVWWENAYGMPLHYRVRHDEHRISEPGLYIPGRRFALQTRVSEGKSLYDTRVMREDDLFQEVESIVEERLGYQVPPEVGHRFSGRVMDGMYAQRWINPPLLAEHIDRSVFVAINDHLKTARGRIAELDLHG